MRQIQRILLLINDNLYNSKRYFALRLAEALERKGVKVKIIDTPQGELKKEDLTALYRFNPDVSCSFNSLLPLADGGYLWDAMQTPHVTFFLDPAIYVMHLTKSKYAMLSYVDRNDQSLIESTGFKTSFFFPHAVERERLDVPLNDRRPYDVIMMGSCYDHESLRKSWEKNYSKEICHAIEETIERTLNEPETSFVSALVDAWKKIDVNPEKVDFKTICSYIDHYMRGQDRYDLIRSITDHEVHIFGSMFWEEAEELNGWDHYFKDQENVHIHPMVSFEKSFEILEKSRLCLNSTPFFKNGSHERLFCSLASGCSVLTSENVYAREIFGEDNGIHYYRHDDLSRVNDQITEILANDQEAVRRGRQIVADGHTWDHRADLLLETLPKLFGEVYARTTSPN